MSQSLRAELRPEALGFNYPDPEVFVRSQWRCGHYIYLVWRALWLLWHLSITVASAVNFADNIAQSTDEGVKWLLYFSHVTFLVTVVACACDLVGALRAGRAASESSASDAKKRGNNSSGHTDKEEILFRGEFTIIEGLKEAPTAWLSQVTWFLYSIVNTSNILSTAWFWAVTYDKHRYAVEVIAHVTNSVFVLSNLLVSALPVRLLHFVYPGVYTGIYIAFTGIYRAAGGRDEHGRSVIYRPLEWNDAFPTALTVVVGLVVVVPLLHCVTFAAYTFRVYLHASLNSASYAPSAEYEAKVPAVSYHPDTRPGGRQSEPSARLENDTPTSNPEVTYAPSGAVAVSQNQGVVNGAFDNTT